MHITLTVLQWNARSVLNKLDILDKLIKKHDPDVILLCETWLTERDEDFVIPDYKIFRVDRSVVRGGGVAVAVRRDTGRWQCRILGRRNDLEFQCLIVNVDIPFWLPMKFASVYMPRFQTLGISRLAEMVRNKRDLFIGGDFNAHHQLWSSQSNSIGNRLLQMFDDNYLKVLNRGGTTRGGSTPDVTVISRNYCANEEIKIVWSVDRNNCSSDHQPIVTKIQLPLLGKAGTSSNSLTGVQTMNVRTPEIWLL